MQYSPELYILKIFVKDREAYETFFSQIKGFNYDVEIKTLLNTIDNYYSSYIEHLYIGKDELKAYYNSLYSIDKNKEYIYTIIETIYSIEISDSIIKDIIRNMIERDISLSVIDKLTQVIAENKYGILTTITEDVARYDSLIQAQDPESLFVTPDLSILLEKRKQRSALKWRLNALQSDLGNLEGGTLGHIFARPECLHPATPVMLFSGVVVRANQVLPGWKLMGDDSTPRTVIQTMSGQAPMYEISYSWGDSYIVNEQHILSLKRSRTEAYHKHGDILNVSVKDYLTWPEGRKSRYKGWKTGVEYNTPAPQLLNPYILGIWLGDGHSKNTSITNADSVILNTWMEWGKNVFGLSPWIYDTPHTGKAVTISLTGSKGKGIENPIRQLLRGYNVWDNKHIPQEYLRCRREDRLALLAGLIDTDGSVARQGYEITQKREVLAKDILNLSRSLGYHATIKRRVINQTDYWRVNIQGNFKDLPVQVQYKKIISNLNPKRKGLQFGFKIKALGIGNYCGFTLTGNHLFVLGDYTVTHNTGKTSFLASEITNLVSQLEQDETILWCNNEQEESKVLTRFYTTLLNAPEEKIINNIEAAKLAYIQRMGDKIKLYDNAYISTDGIRHLIKTINPRVVVIDQGDKVSFSGSNKLEGHSRLKELYRMFRELAKEFNTHIITVGQASSEAAGKKWLEMHHMDNSRTAKPGEMDYIIGIGMQLSTSDVGEEDELRYLHLCKNKCTGVHSKHIVRFDRTIGRYLNI